VEVGLPENRLSSLEFRPPVTLRTPPPLRFVVDSSRSYRSREAVESRAFWSVLLGRAFRRSSLSFTLGALAIVDSGVLCTALPRQWIMFMTDDQLDIRTTRGSNFRVVRGSTLCDPIRPNPIRLTNLTAWCNQMLSNRALNALT